MARELTALSNEGTLLGYVRTALAFVAAGFAMVHFFKARSLIAIAGLWIAFGAGLASWGVHRFRQVRGVIRSHTALGDMRAGTP
jgi:putative membrane protein